MDLTYAVCVNLAEAQHANKLYVEALNTYTQIVRSRSFPQARLPRGYSHTLGDSGDSSSDFLLLDANYIQEPVLSYFCLYPGINFVACTILFLLGPGTELLSEIKWQIG